MTDGFIKVAAGTPKIRVADVSYNRDSILALIKKAGGKGVKILTLPELCLSGYTCADLFEQDVLLSGAEEGLAQILSATADTDMLFALGLPVRSGGKLYDCAAVCCSGELLALVPKTSLRDCGGLSETRWFTASDCTGKMMSFAGRETYFGRDVLFNCSDLPELCVGVEICEDIGAAVPPSSALALAGATLILNLSASGETAGRADYRRELVKNQSARLVCGYVFADAGDGESTTDTVFCGHDLIAENGGLLAESRFDTGLVISELDIGRLIFERRRIAFCRSSDNSGIVRKSFNLQKSETELTREINPLPFIPQDSEKRAERCGEVLRIAALGLKKRLEHTHTEKLVLGVSGGLDSTLAMLISTRALDMLGLERENLIAVTMPCFGTTPRTRGNAEKLTSLLGAQLKTVEISAAVRQHFADIGHDENDRNVVYENSQARERTQVLMDIANGCGALVVGTGDMSELALGWATYNGDHMSMYGVNSGIPKTLVRHLVAYCADTAESGELKAVLTDVLETPVSPELLPAFEDDISQRTEELVGPYELHDFFLYYFVRWGFRPKKVLRLAEYAFAGVYGRETILKWLRIFISRFFSQQFKRSCLPDGPKVGTLSLSPRGDWHMPSDAVCRLWLEELGGL